MKIEDVPKAHGILAEINQVSSHGKEIEKMKEDLLEKSQHKRYTIPLEQAVSFIWKNASNYICECIATEINACLKDHEKMLLKEAKDLGLDCSEYEQGKSKGTTCQKKLEK